MAVDYSGWRIFSCCKKYQHSVCLKIWIMIFVCGLLCSTCLVIESRRNELNKRQRNTARRDAQKLIQLKITTPLPQGENRYVLSEESSGDDMPSMEYRHEIPLLDDHLSEIDNSIDQPIVHENSPEMVASSNCISKSNGLLDEITAAAPVIDFDKEPDYKDLIEDVEKLLDYPEFSETQVRNILLNCDTNSEVNCQSSEEAIDANGLTNKIHDLDDKVSAEQQSNQAIFQLSLEPHKSSVVQWDSEDRFFPDEYAFQYDFSKDDRSSKILSEMEYPTSGELLRKTDLSNEEEEEEENEEIPLQEVNLPSIIEGFLGKVSTFFGPSLQISKPYQDISHLANFKDKQFSFEPMKLSASKLRPISDLKLPAFKKFHRKSLNPKAHPNSNKNSMLTNRRHGSIMGQLLDFNRNKNI